MLVEDDNNLREIYGERLMAEGYEIVSAGDGEEALALAVKEKPDLIISDVMMPKISGFDMLDILRQTPETKDTKVIMMTALSQSEDKDRADKLGADKYLVKSQVTLEDVARVVHDLLYGAEESTPETASAGPETATQAPVVTAPAPVAEAPEAETAVVEPTVVAPQAVAEPPADPVVTDTATPAVAAPTADNPIPATEEPDNDGEPVVLPPAAPEAAPVAEAPEAETAVVEPTVVAPQAVAEPEAAPAEAPVINPIVGVAAEAVAPASNGVESATAQSTEDETQQITDQINQFVNAQLAEEPKHEEPLVEPSEQDLIHAQNEVEAPTVIQPAVDPTVPQVVTDDSDASNPEPASARKKVISPLNDPTTSGPNINELYEQEMAKEAADSPVINPGAGATLDAPVTNNPIVGNPEAIQAPAALETIDVSQIEGLSVGEEQPLAPPPSPIAAATVTPQAPAAEEKPVDPNDPASFAL